MFFQNVGGAFDADLTEKNGIFVSMLRMPSYPISMYACTTDFQSEALCP